VFSYLRTNKALVNVSSSDTSKEEAQWDEKSQERSPEEDTACAESALATLSDTWVQNAFGAEVTDVVFSALNELIESRKRLIIQQKTADISQPEQARQARKLDD
jgi:hypothetical protein